MTNLEEVRRLINHNVGEYNTHRLHSALNYLTPADYLQGPEHVQKRLAARRSALAAAADRRRTCWNNHPDQGLPPVGVT